jgi:hypothetical protein
MFLRRVIEHVKAQNRTAVALDFGRGGDFGRYRRR